MQTRPKHRFVDLSVVTAAAHSGGHILMLVLSSLCNRNTCLFVVGLCCLAVCSGGRACQYPRGYKLSLPANTLCLPATVCHGQYWAETMQVCISHWGPGGSMWPRTFHVLGCDWWHSWLIGCFSWSMPSCTDHVRSSQCSLPIRVFCDVQTWYICNHDICDLTILQVFAPPSTCVTSGTCLWLSDCLTLTLVGCCCAQMPCTCALTVTVVKQREWSTLGWEMLHLTTRLQPQHSCSWQTTQGIIYSNKSVSQQMLCKTSIA